MRCQIVGDEMLDALARILDVDAVAQLGALRLGLNVHAHQLQQLGHDRDQCSA